MDGPSNRSPRSITSGVENQEWRRAGPGTSAFGKLPPTRNDQGTAGWSWWPNATEVPRFRNLAKSSDSDSWNGLALRIPRNPRRC